MFFKNKKKYFHLQHSGKIGMYRKEYLKIKENFPFHSCESIQDIVLIKFTCPYKRFFTNRKYYHFGKRLDFKYGLKYNLFNEESGVEALKVGKGINTNVHTQGDIALPEEFTPCSMCEKELTCMFSKTKAEYNPVNYTFFDFINILQGLGYEESMTLYNKYVSFYSENSNDAEVEDVGMIDVIIVLFVAFPIAILYVPTYFLIDYFKKIKEKTFDSQKA
ncbi:hypothetical protein [Bacillus toyonensis]|uniref:hypothetical protein n=1 Tax=Bacillus toyonensis TaxID=155322 RepID=UPI002E246CC5|nr:hypothetical protein [Bacillus toyonensis]